MHVSKVSVSSLLLFCASTSGCDDPSGVDDLLVDDDSSEVDEPSRAVDPSDVDDLLDIDPKTQLEQPPVEDCPVGLDTDECQPDPYLCTSRCSSSAYCNTECSYYGQIISCEDYGTCQIPCAQACSAAASCNKSCYQNGAATTCGQFGVCNPPPDCLVEFWTGYGYTGTRDCYGTQADVENAVGKTGSLAVQMVIKNDQYSSFRTIEQVCLDRGISPCHLAGTPNAIKTGITTIYKDFNLSGMPTQFADSADKSPDFRTKYWGNSPIMGNIDKKMSSFVMSFSVGPTCFHASGLGGCNLCIDGGAWLVPYKCTTVAKENTAEGWYKTKNIWVHFDGGSYAPTKFSYVNGKIVWGLQKNFYLMYPGTMHDIDWIYSNNDIPPVYFQLSVPGAF